MLSSIYQYVINPAVSLPIRRDPCVIMYLSVRKYLSISKHIFYVAKFLILTSLSLPPYVDFIHNGLKIFSLPNFALISPNRIFIWYLTCSNSL